METSENEMWVDEKIKYFLDSENILNVALYGDIDFQTATDYKAAHNKLINTIKGKINILVDLNKSGKQSTEARNIWKKLSEERDTTVALFGTHAVAKIVASFYLKFSKVKNTRFFNNKEKAIEWLKTVK